MCICARKAGYFMTVIQETNERMQELMRRRMEDLAAIQEKMEEARAQLQEAEAAMNAATEQLDVDSYEKANAKARMAKTAQEMLRNRYDQIERRELISEADSDATIDSLLEYENNLAATFKDAVKEHIAALAGILDDYQKEVRAAELTIQNWCRDVRPNFRTFGQTTRYDAMTDQYTDRSETPVPVHQMPYTGCNEAAQLATYLRKTQGGKWNG